MLHRSERILDNIPVGSLGIIAVDGCEEMGNKVNDYLVKWRKEETRFQKDNLVFNGYEKPNYLINAKVPRFGSGEAKGIINESVPLFHNRTCSGSARSERLSSTAQTGLPSYS